MHIGQHCEQAILGIVESALADARREVRSLDVKLLSSGTRLESVTTPCDARNLMPLRTR